MINNSKQNRKGKTMKVMTQYNAQVVIARDSDTALPTSKADEIFDLGTFSSVEKAKQKLIAWDGPEGEKIIRVVDQDGDDVDEPIYL